jgi:hypothetical protein
VNSAPRTLLRLKRALALGLVALVAAPGLGSAPARSGGLRYRFADVTAEARLTGSTRTWGAAWADYDLDGDPDLLVGRHHATPRLYRNDGGLYSVVQDAGIQQAVDRHGCAWGEANEDGKPDLFCQVGANHGTGTGPKQLLIQTKTGFDNQAGKFGVVDALARGRTTNWIDYDGDGDLDLFLGNQQRRKHPNQMFRRRGTRFIEARAGVADQLTTLSSSWADWDRDGDPDLLVTQHRLGSTVAYENHRGQFEETKLRGITGKDWSSGAWGDYDGDGWIDLNVVGKWKNAIFRNVGGRFTRVYHRDIRQGRMSVWLDVDNDTDLDLFVVQGSPGNFPKRGAQNRADFLVLQRDTGFDRLRGFSYRGPTDGNGDSVAAADHNRDGRMDLFITNGLFHWAGPNELLENRTDGGNWAALDLTGSPANPFGMGSSVFVQAGSRSFWTYTSDGSNFRSQSEPGYVHLGLGPATAATARITWADGTRDCVNFSAGSIVMVNEGAHPCA